MGSDGETGRPIAEFLRFCSWVLLASVVIGALGYLPTRALVDGGAVAAMLAALGAAALASILGGVPVVVARLRGEAKPSAVMVSTILRLVAVVVLAVLAALLLKLPTGPFLIWLALSYLLLLVIDTRYAMSVLGSP